MIMILNDCLLLSANFQRKSKKRIWRKKTRNQTVFIEKFGRLNLIIYFCNKFSVVFVKTEKMATKIQQILGTAYNKSEATRNVLLTRLILVTFI